MSMISLVIIVVITTLAGYSVWHGYHLRKLERQLQKKKSLKAPYPRGAWGRVYKQVNRFYKRGRKHKRRLSRFQKRFAESASAFPDAIVILGDENKIEWCNPAAQHLLGLAWPLVFNKSFTTAVSDPMISEYLERKEFEKPLELQSPGTSSKIISVSVTRFGKKRQKLVMARDISASYNLNRVRRDFIANASHELKTPLTVIRGFLENLDEPDLDREQWIRSVELMQRQALRMEHTINDLMSLSQLEMDTEKPNYTEVAIPDMLASIIDEAQSLSGEQRHQIASDIDNDLYLRGIEGELYSAFSNLIFNAVRHTTAHTRIQILWSRHNDGAIFSVKDEGQGIAARHLPRLSERFYRVDPGRSRSSGGTGLGLAIVKHVLERHESELNIESAVGYGSTFSCYFPPSRIIQVPTTFTEKSA